MNALNIEPTLREKFERWTRDPGSALQLLANPTGAVPTLQLIEDALWVAYRAGYAQGLQDTDGLERVLEHLKSKGE